VDKISCQNKDTHDADIQSSIRGRGSPLMSEHCHAQKTLLKRNGSRRRCTRIDAAVRLAETGYRCSSEVGGLDPDQTHRKWSENSRPNNLAFVMCARNIVKRANEAKKIKKEMIETSFVRELLIQAMITPPPLLEYSAICRASRASKAVRRL